MFQNPLAAPMLYLKQKQRTGWYLTEQMKHDIPAQENPTNMSHVSHAQSMYGPRPYVSHTVNA
jgi:hypothetical protein